MRIPNRRHLIIVFAMLLVVLSTATFLILGSVKTVVKDVIAEATQATSREVHAKVEQYLLRPKTIGKTISSALEAGYLSGDDHNALARLFWNLPQRDSGFPISSIYFSTIDGVFTGIAAQRSKSSVAWAISRSPEGSDGVIGFYRADNDGAAGTFIKSGGQYDPVGRPWFQHALATKAPGWTEMYANFGSGNGVMTWAGAYRPDNKLVSGVYAIDVTPGRINEFLFDQTVSENTEIHLLDKNGVTISSNRKPVDSIFKGQLDLQSLQLHSTTAVSNELQANSAQAVLSASGQHMTVDDTSGYLYLSALDQSVGLQWSVAVFTPETDYVTSIAFHKLKVLPMLLLVVLMAGLVLCGLFYLTARSLRRLRASTMQVAAGNIDVPIDAGTGELGDITTAIESMRNSLRSAFSKLRTQSVNAETTLAALADGVITVNDKGLVTYMNSSAELQTGMSSSAANGKLLSEVFKVSHDELYKSPVDLSTLLAGVVEGDSLDHQMFVIDPNGAQRKVECRIRATRDADESISGAVLVFSDVTCLIKSNQDLQLALDERTHAMEELAASQNQLENAQKSESVGRLAGGISHDFNNLLTIILSAAYLAQERLAEKDSMHYELETIKEAAEKAAELTGQLLAFSRQEVMLLAPISLNQACRESAQLMRRVVGEHIAIDTELQATPDTVFVDRSRLDQVIMNLVINARDAMAEGGQLTIRTQGSDGFVELQVIDQGHGIPDDLVNKIFDPFVSTKPVGVGTGLGLSTVKGIVKQFGGTIDVRSIQGVYSSFIVKLPVVQVDLLQQKKTTPTIPSAEPRTVLIVEDNVNVLRMMERTLTSIGYQVITADRPSKGLEFASHDGPIDCLISDLVMPEEDGLSFVRKFLKLRQLPVVMMTGHVPDPTMRASLVDKNVTLLRKPFRPDELVERILESMVEEVE